MLLIYLYDFAPEPNIRLSKNIFFDVSKYKAYFNGKKVSFLSKINLLSSTLTDLKNGSLFL